uniref:Uncharacterized protein n=1 Tax=Candidatus Kentrum sp. LPFa TaxID=2126335 RepID=A0A450WF70_9GAMM|nr:MAG: hypothetical protein BECKLPF1236A_GA0070988_101303 [Candidatus Kentron sp. LPFa]
MPCPPMRPANTPEKALSKSPPSVDGPLRFSSRFRAAVAGSSMRAPLTMMEGTIKASSRSSPQVAMANNRVGRNSNKGFFEIMGLTINSVLPCKLLAGCIP